MKQDQPLRQLTKEEWLDEVNYPNRPRETIPMTPADEKPKKKAAAKKKKKEDDSE